MKTMAKTRNNIPRIRALLRYSDGMTIKQIAAALGRDPHSIDKSIRTMPDAYQDRWVKEVKGRGAFAAVWCVVVPPPNCPHPTRKTK